MSQSSRHLNCDILSIVAEHADRQTAARMMVCCRALCRYTPRLLLAEPVDLDYLWGDCARHAERLVSFLRFMNVEDGKRWRFLRGLIFGYRIPGPPQIVRALAQGILQAPNIKYLELRDIDDLLAGHGEIRDALASLKNVKHLKVAHAAKHACTFLEGVRWPLVTVSLSIADDFEGDWKLPKIYQRLHPASLLRSARDTLVELSCDSWDITDYRKRFPDYPHVKTLHEIGIRSPMTPEWVKTYPNLTHLLVFTFLTENRISLDEDDRVQYESIRLSNLEALEQRCWPRLDEVQAGCVTDFYLIGLPCRVRKVVLGTATWGLPLLPEALDRVCPVILDLSTRGECFASAFKTYFEQAANALQDLEELRIWMRFDRDHLSIDVARVLAEGASALRILPKLRQFTLHLSCSFERGVLFSPSPSLEPLHVAERSLHGLNRRAFYQELFRATPTLEIIEFATYGVRDMDRIDERVERSEVVA
ncbi:hypothetical protein C8Q76DRAFT_787426 [Earliella scabrosa]|nr:hypothetical protein C8Q76DRAFT_787426 [Earliella scabrosa]